MPFHDLPPRALEILTKYAAPPRLVAHLVVVHDVAVTLIAHLQACWPVLVYDRERVLLGAATHDIGKVVYTNELAGPGVQHEEVGPQLLLACGLSEAEARFARTHARWEQESTFQLEDMLVAFADTIWKGKRDEGLEQVVARLIAQQSREEIWQVYIKLDDIACELAKDADERILWQGKHAI